MKKLHLKETNRPSVWRSGMSNVRRLTTCTAIVLAGMLASCSEDDVNNEGNDPVVPESNTVSLKLISGAEQTGRIECIPSTKSEVYGQRGALQFVGKILPLDERKEWNWSATSVTFNEDGTKAYITWHSDRQAEDPATVWGGAVDVINLTGDEALKLASTGVSDLLKFNQVLYDNGKLFLASTSAKTAGVVGRIQLTNGEITGDPVNVDCIGFPGMSVNAVAKCADGKLVAISGYTGTYGTFDSDVTAQPYYYGDKTGENVRENVITTSMDNTVNFGGKYVTTDEEGTTYILYDSKDEKSAKIQKLGEEKVFNLGHKLISSKKVAESYDYETGKWVLSKEEHTYYGKHVFAVKDGKAYVACGEDGLLVYDLNAETGFIAEQSKRATGVCVDKDFVYAVTGTGLRIYYWTTKGENSVFGCYASEVKEYDVNGLPITKDNMTEFDTPIMGTAERHSPNFVAVNPATGHIFVVYGQSGVRVYKFRSEEEEKQPEVTK